MSSIPLFEVVPVGTDENLYSCERQLLPTISFTLRTLVMLILPESLVLMVTFMLVDGFCFWVNHPMV
jgi:hypothetical protein